MVLPNVLTMNDTPYYLVTKKYMNRSFLCLFVLQAALVACQNEVDLNDQQIKNIIK